MQFLLALLSGFLLFPVVVIGFGLLMHWDRNDYDTAKKRGPWTLEASDAN